MEHAEISQQASHVQQQQAALPALRASAAHAANADRPAPAYGVVHGCAHPTAQHSPAAPLPPPLTVRIAYSTVTHFNTFCTYRATLLGFDRSAFSVCSRPPLLSVP
eukprot:165566-Chlamydomonas_euryale.AAC.3